MHNVHFQSAVAHLITSHISLISLSAQQTVEVVEEVVRGYKGVLLVVSHGERDRGPQEVILGILCTNNTAAAAAAAACCLFHSVLC